MISVQIGPEATFLLEKTQKDLTPREIVEINNYYDELIFTLGNSLFIAFPLTIFMTHLIFRKKKKD